MEHKHKIYKKYRKGKQGGQHYWVGQKTYGSKFMSKRELNRLISRREKEGIIVLPTYEGFIFHDPETRERKVIFEAKKKNYGTFSGKTDVPFVDFPHEYGYKKKKRMLTPEKFMQLARATSTDDEWKGKPLEEYKKATVLWHRVPFEKKLKEKGESEEMIEKFRKATKFQEERLDKIKIALMSKEKIVPSPYIEFREGKPYEHEGRHRVVAAEEIGMKKVPVFFVYKKNEPTPK